MSQLDFSWRFLIPLNFCLKDVELLVHRTTKTTFLLLLKHSQITFRDLFAHCWHHTNKRRCSRLCLMHLLSLIWQPLVHEYVSLCVCTGWSFVPCSFDPACQSKARTDFCVSAIREQRGRVWMVTYGIPAEAALWSPEEAWKTNRCLHTSLPVLGVHWQASLQREGTVTAACHSAELCIHKPQTHTRTTRWGEIMSTVSWVDTHYSYKYFLLYIAVNICFALKILCTLPKFILCECSCSYQSINFVSDVS